ncbi:hypothetical protein HBI56_117550 [Parastagonospora nodorum]|nr:hypothetical protein HBH50_125120 [Parastagonospora nodorum]KAH4085468.1 hypothetical protein HBH48_150030 [Parastagonospora nodorum]KAH4102939.1 hypothetical protein HBH46_118590 [Parastagonospora nodorum]KAH4126757.1 hypothetical protein HBH47_047220 [Parastagonospora nodorum]KAH4167178.1 hypothetical protein HBH43_134240 [Parastagonospora nodorum]
MLEQTKTFISRVSHHAEKTSSPLSPDLILAIQTLKRSSRKTHADPNLFKLLTFLFKITLSTTGPPSSGNADDRLSTIARLKSIEKTDAKHKLCDILADLEVRKWWKVDKSWTISGPNLTCWMVALVGIVEGWGVSYEDLMKLVRGFHRDRVYESDLTNAVMKAYGLWARMKVEG